MLTRICRIIDHPVATYPDKIRDKYVKGLGCVLHIVSGGHPTMRMMYEQWGFSIAGKDVSLWFDSKDNSQIKEALSLNRIGIHFFRLKYQFYFDCFYLTESFDKALLSKLQEILQQFGYSIYTKFALKKTYGFFLEKVGELKIENSLLEHRNLNKEFLNRYEKRILIVATVSAGKSTLINALTGHMFNRVMTGVCTNHICKIHNKITSDGITYKKTEVLEYDSNIDSYSSEEIYEAALHFESSLGNERICFIDTPGVNNSRDLTHRTITSDAVKSGNYDFVIFVSNGQYNGTNDERYILELIHKNCETPILFVLNQLDKFKKGVDNIEKMIREYTKELNSIGFNSPKVYPLSAQYAYLLRNEKNLDEDEKDELIRLRKKFANKFLDLQHYQKKDANNEMEKSGISLLEKTIINL